MRRILVFEYLHAAADAYAAAAATMRREGRSMLLAVVADLAKLDNVQISVAVCEAAADSLPLPKDVSIVTVRATSETEFVNEVLSGERFDEVLPIAPETDDQLTTVLDLFRRRGQSTLVAPLATVAIAACKWQTYSKLRRHRLPTIPTARLADVASLNLQAQETCVIKPSKSAGCDGIQSCLFSDLQAAVAERTEAERAELLVQPWIDGQSYSVGLIGTTILPPALQDIVWTNNRPQYLGGTVPADLPAESLSGLKSLLTRLLPAIPLKRGYVGIDLLRTANRGTSEWLITEINPRLCTSYIGYRKATSRNLSDLLLGGTVPDFQWNQVPVCFSVDE